MASPTLPAAVSTLPAAVRAFYLDAIAKAAGGLTLEEFGQILHSFGMLSTAAVASFTIDGPAKKAAVVAWSLMLYDGLVSHVVFPWWLYPFKPIVRAVVAAAIGGAVESAYQWTIKRKG